MIQSRYSTFAANVAVAFMGIVIALAVAGCSSSGQESASSSATADAAAGAGETSSIEQMANNVSLAGGAASEGAGYDYFYGNGKGLCRATPESGAEVIREIAVQDGTPEFYVSGIASTDDAVFFLANSYSAGGTTAEVRCISLDGGDEHTIYTADSQTGGSFGLPQSVYVYGDKLYMLCSRTNGSNTSQVEYNVVSMSCDGSDAETLCTVAPSGTIASMLVTPECVFYAESTYSGSAGTTYAVRAQAFDGSDPVMIYETNSGASIAQLALSDDRIVFEETNYSTGESAVMSVAADGSDSQTLSTSSEGRLQHILALSDGTVYVQDYSSDTQGIVESWNLLAVATSNGECHTIAESVSAMSPTFSAVNGHLLLQENGQGMGETGMSTVVLSLDGEKLAEYTA